MGFGLCVLGYFLTIFDTFGAGLIGWPLLAIGLWKLTCVNRKFIPASVTALVSVFYSVVSILTLFETVSQTGTLYKAASVASLVLGLCLHVFMLLGIRETAKAGGSEKLALSAASCLYLSAVYYIAAIAVVFIPAISSGTFTLVLALTRYFIGIINTVLLFNCFAKITTEKQQEKDDRYFAELDRRDREKAADRAAKDAEAVDAVKRKHKRK